MSLTELRKKIDSIDRKLVALLNARTRIAIEIGELKERQGLEPYDPVREEKVLQTVEQLNSGPLESSALKSIYRAIMSSALAIEKHNACPCKGNLKRSKAKS